MSTGLEDETDPGEPQWHQDDSIELDEMCAEYRRLESAKKVLESSAKEYEKPLDRLGKQIQAKMGEHKAVRTSAGYTVAWVPSKRKSYTVEAWVGERWQLGSPF